MGAERVEYTISSSGGTRVWKYTSTRPGYRPRGRQRVPALTGTNRVALLPRTAVARVPLRRPNGARSGGAVIKGVDLLAYPTRSGESATWEEASVARGAPTDSQRAALNSQLVQ